MSPTPKSPTDADYLIPWATIEADRTLTPSIKNAFLSLLDDDKLVRQILDPNNFEPAIVDLRLCSELDFRRARGVGKANLRKLKTFLEKHGKRIPALPRPEASLDHWTLAARHFKAASEFHAAEIAMIHLPKGLLHLTLACRDMDAVLRGIDSKLDASRTPTLPDLKES